MPGLARIRHITFDCHDPYALSRFWAEVLGFEDDPDDPNHPDDPEALIVDPTGHHPGLLFVPVPEGKAGKNRLHLDLRPTALRDDTVEQVVALGGVVVADHREADGAGWVVVADPEGNELCIERSAAERAAPAPVDTGERPLTTDRSGDERMLLTQMLDWYRDGVLVKVRDLSEAHARALPVRSDTSIIGLLKHLAVVEDSWFARFLGVAPPEPWTDVDWDADPNWEFHSAREQPLAEVVELYEAACRRSREITATHHLDEVRAEPDRPAFSLRWMLLHLIEETARHLGHLDVLREHLDGTTGE